MFKFKSNSKKTTPRSSGERKKTTSFGKSSSFRPTARNFHDDFNLSRKSQELIPVTLKRHGDKKGGHPHVILENIDDKHVSVGLSSDSMKGKNSPNYRCENDVVGNGKQSFLRRQGTVDFVENYYEKTTGRMTEKDFSQAKVYGERAKQKYLDEKNKK